MEQEDMHYTYSDYAEWDDGRRCELINGIIYMMSPAPGRKHQSISRELLYQLAHFLKGKPWQAFTAPFDVRLNADEGDDTVVQPDLLVVCDNSKLDTNGCVGAPDVVIEILSPSTAQNDKVLKFNIYRKAGVREYWIVDPDSKSVQTCLLNDGQYIIKAYTDTDTAPVTVLQGCTINLKDVFEQ